jgi:glycosyl hydrolase family 32
MNSDGVYRAEGFYIWDNCVVEHAGHLHRYALSASAHLPPEQRHDYASLRHAVSADGGASWEDRGTALEANQGGTWPDLAIWTCHIVLRATPGAATEFLLFVTGRGKSDGELQRIGLAKSADGHNFSPPKVVLNPTTKSGYDITDSDRVIMAWRDPFVFLDRQDRVGHWHMLFAAKAAAAAGAPIATVGHAIAQDDDLEQWELQPPLQLPRHYRQLEVPSLVRRRGWYYLFVSTQDRPRETDNAAKRAAFRGYVAPSLSGPWKLVYGHTDQIYGHEIYAPLVFERRRDTREYAAVAFFSESTTLPITGTPIIPIEWKQDKALPWEKPVFDFQAIEGFIQKSSPDRNPALNQEAAACAGKTRG